MKINKTIMTLPVCGDTATYSFSKTTTLVKTFVDGTALFYAFAKMDFDSTAQDFVLTRRAIKYVSKQFSITNNIRLEPNEEGAISCVVGLHSSTLEKASQAPYISDADRDMLRNSATSTLTTLSQPVVSAIKRGAHLQGDSYGRAFGMAITPTAICTATSYVALKSEISTSIEQLYLSPTALKLINMMSDSSRVLHDSVNNLLVILDFATKGSVVYIQLNESEVPSFDGIIADLSNAKYTIPSVVYLPIVKQASKISGGSVVTCRLEGDVLSVRSQIEEKRARLPERLVAGDFAVRFDSALLKPFIPSLMNATVSDSCRTIRFNIGATENLYVATQVI